LLDHAGKRGKNLLPRHWPTAATTELHPAASLIRSQDRGIKESPIGRLWVSFPRLAHSLGCAALILLPLVGPKGLSLVPSCFLATLRPMAEIGNCLISQEKNNHLRQNYPAGKEEEMAWKALNHGLRGSLAYGNHPCSHSQATTSGSKAAISNARRSDQRLNGRPRGDAPGRLLQFRAAGGP